MAAAGMTPPAREPGSKSGDAKIQSSLSALSASLNEQGREAAYAFAGQRAMRLTDGRVQVVLETTGSPEAVTDEIKAAGGVVNTTNGGLIQAELQIEDLESLADLSQVSRIREPRRPSLFTVSEGATDAGVSAWHAAGDTGGSTRVAVLDPGFAGYSQRIAEGELPAGAITMSFAADGDITGGGESHGTACAEIVYDMAPGAQLYLINFGTDVELANAIDYLIAQDIDVVSASWGFFGAFRGDGQGNVNDMVAEAAASGIFWANASGNAAQTHWSGQFVDANADTWHEFAPGDLGNDITASSGTTIDVFLTWDSWPVTDQDYDVYLIYEVGNKTVAWGDSWQSGVEEPAEEIHYTVPPGKSGRYWISISNYSATGGANFHLYTYPGNLEYQVAAGSLGGQPADSPVVMTVGAVPAGGTTIESFSSRGPTVDGRIKPDIVAADRVSTVTYGTKGFWGTSAAAPHVAGAGALVMAAEPDSTPEEVRALLESRALELGAAGKDNIFGSGKLRMGVIIDNSPPVIGAVTPTGTIDSTSALISVSYSDSRSGIDTASVVVTLDGAELAGCTIGPESVSCPVADLSTGPHVIGGSVADLAGNAAAISGSFSVICGKPMLIADAGQPYWANYDSYLAGDLSLDWTIGNEGLNDAFNVMVVGNVNSNSVIVLSAFPMEMGDIVSGAGSTVTLTYRIPDGVASFRSSSYATAADGCENSYYYPAPYLET